MQGSYYVVILSIIVLRILQIEEIPLDFPSFIETSKLRATRLYILTYVVVVYISFIKRQCVHICMVHPVKLWSHGEHTYVHTKK